MSIYMFYAFLVHEDHKDYSLLLWYQAMIHESHVKNIVCAYVVGNCLSPAFATFGLVKVFDKSK